MKLNRKNSSKSIAAESPRRSFDGARMAKGLFGAALSIATLTASLAAPQALHAQSVSFAGVQSTLPLQGLGEVTGIVMDETGNLYIADDTNNCIWKVTPTGVQTKLQTSAGQQVSAGTVTQLAVDSGGKLFHSGSE